MLHPDEETNRALLEAHGHFPVESSEKVWDLVPAIFKPAADATMTVQKLLQLAPKMVNLPPTGLGRTPLFPWIVWQLWTARNKLIFDDKLFSERELVSRAIKEARNWKEAQLAIPAQRTRDPTQAKDGPTVAEYSCFVDAAWSAETGSCGMGWFFQKDQDSLRLQGASHRLCVGSALMAEALALRSAVAAAKTLHFTSVSVFSDSQSLISMISSRNASNELKGVLHDIFQLSTAFESIGFFHIPRLSNSVADAIAKAAMPHVVTSPFGE
ncbi:unnamed protein product [Microthlaspi erraticum]|uniref:RNase H type-1 domain-containing protein n=1 Tax=Microthlaspi erraticum TaxID=1685480 RepID=A0A6D2K1G7_9BRAS|nr:unnamed protein product [Microthlaspi erraticum]